MGHSRRRPRHPGQPLGGTRYPAHRHALEASARAAIRSRSPAANFSIRAAASYTATASARGIDTGSTAAHNCATASAQDSTSPTVTRSPYISSAR